MDNLSQPNGFQQTSAGNSKSKKKLSRKTMICLGIASLTLLILIGIFYAGDRRGARRQKALDDKKKSTSTAADFKSNIIKDYWSIVGSVEDVSNKSIKVKNNKGLVEEAEVTSSTSITEKPSKKVEIGAVKKGARVVVTGTKTDDGKITAKVIRIQ